MTILPSFVHTLESNMRAITVSAYNRLSEPGNLWVWDVAKIISTVSKKERLMWLLETAKIERPLGSDGGGNMIFEDMVSQSQEFEVQNAVAGLELKKEQLEDLYNGTPGGEAFERAGHWARQIGSYGAYWPQKEVAKAILANPLTYDGLAFFHAAHPYNPFNTGAGTYANEFTGAASGAYPGALPIDASVSVDTAVLNIGKALAYLAQIKMPNGEDPRFVKATRMFVPPALKVRATQATNAKFIAQAAGSAAGSGDVEKVISDFNLQPVVVPELGAGFPGGSDTTWYLGAEDLLDGELGAWQYVEREPFSVIYHGPMTSADLARIRRFQWTCEGRNIVAPGHPFLMFRFKST